MNKDKLYKYLFYFILFSFLGWIWEVLFHLIETGEIVNRGMYHGPIIPIYGFGSLLIILLLNKYRNSNIKVFLLSGLICGSMEYITGWFIELTRGYKWWNYSMYPLNLNGRICLYSVLAFSIVGLILIKLILPFLENIYLKYNNKILRIVIIIISIIYLVDIIYSLIVPNSGIGISEKIM